DLDHRTGRLNLDAVVEDTVRAVVAALDHPGRAAFKLERDREGILGPGVVHHRGHGCDGTAEILGHVDPVDAGVHQQAATDLARVLTPAAVRATHPEPFVDRTDLAQLTGVDQFPETSVRAEVDLVVRDADQAVVGVCGPGD